MNTIAKTGRIASTSYKEKKTMEVLWGAWVNDVEYDGKDDPPTVIKGIYEHIHKEKKNDFPFITNLRVLMVNQASLAEIDRIFKLKLEIIDLDGTYRIFSDEADIVVPNKDTPIRWYDDYELKNVQFAEAGYYELYILIDGQHKQSVPLWITDGKTIAWDEKGNEVKGWLEDLDEWFKKP